MGRLIARLPRRSVLVALLCLVGAATLTAPRSASAEEPPLHLRHGAALRSCIDSSRAACAPFGNLAAGTRVRTICVLGTRPTPPHRRTFVLVRRHADGLEGFVPSDAVAGGPTLPRCTQVLRVMAGLAAIDRLGESVARPGDAAAFSDWGAAYGEWSGDCKKLAVASYLSAGVRISQGDALPSFLWERGNAAETGTSRTPPYGALVGYDVARPHGHMAVAIGGDRIVTTKGPDGSRTPNQLSTTWIYPNYLGWAVPRQPSASGTPGSRRQVRHTGLRATDVVQHGAGRAQAGRAI